MAPSERIAYNIDETYAVAVEHYAGYGQTQAITHFNRSYIAVADYKINDANSIESGAGFGLTNASDRMLLKLIINHDV